MKFTIIPILALLAPAMAAPQAVAAPSTVAGSGSIDYENTMCNPAVRARFHAAHNGTEIFNSFRASGAVSLAASASSRIWIALWMLSVKATFRQCWSNTSQDEICGCASCVPELGGFLSAVSAC